MILESGIGNYVTVNGKKHSYFGGNNYLGLAGHPAVKEASIKAIRKYGINFSASRRTTGTSDIHIELEKDLSLFKGKEDTVTFASGYQGNGLLLDMLTDSYSVILTDEFAHPSIISGIPSNKKVFHYKHLDSEDLKRLLEKNEGSGILVITDGVFALTGEISPLDKIYPLTLKHKALLIVDDAHSTGILGKTGKGTPEYFNIVDNGNICQSETMSKALGSYGGFISGDSDFISSIREASTTYQASTALPPAIAAAGIASLKIIRENPDLHISLLKKAAMIRNEITALGYATTPDNTPIIPLIMNSLEEAKNLSSFLLKTRIIVPFINYPVNNRMNMVRMTITSDHTANQTDQLLEMLNKWKKSGSQK